MNLSITEKEIAEIVTGIYESPDRPHFPYHNLTHTKNVVARVQEMAGHYILDEIDAFTLTIAAWFHDIGHVFGDMKDHEERSITIMQLHISTIPPELIVPISQCILATKLPSHPSSLLERIICDADTYHLGTPMFRQTDPLVRQELELRTGKTFPDWRQKSIRLLEQHVFFTGYCRNLLDPGKKENISWLLAQGDGSSFIIPPSGS